MRLFEDIQETVYLDKRHTIVPFISDRGDHGVSYWQWQKHKWQVMSIEMKGDPRLWKIDPNDPSTYYLVWNWDPNDQLSYMKFYFVRDREYFVSDGIATYKPKIQMVKRVDLKGQTFGVLKVPSDWAESMNLLRSAESMQPTSLMNFNGRFSDQQSYFGYTPYDKEDKLADIMNSVNGNSYTTENSQIELVRLLEEPSIEVPKH